MVPNYESMLEAVYTAALRDGDVAIDIGAHVGRHTLPMARAVGVRGKVYAYEPLPSIYVNLMRAVETARESDRNLAEVVMYNLALGELEGSAQFIYTPDFPEYSGFRERLYHVDNVRKETIKVQVTRLDSMREQIGQVHFIKIDAEGGELTILKGARALITDSLPIISFEMGNAALVNYPYTAADYYDFFTGLGYKVFSIFGIKLTRSEFVMAAESQFYWDYVAIPEGEWPFNHISIQILINQFDVELNRQAEHTNSKAQVSVFLKSKLWRIAKPLQWLTGIIKR